MGRVRYRQWTQGTRAEVDQFVERLDQRGRDGVNVQFDVNLSRHEVCQYVCFEQCPATDEGNAVDLVHATKCELYK